MVGKEVVQHPARKQKAANPVEQAQERIWADHPQVGPGHDHGAHQVDEEDVERFKFWNAAGHAKGFVQNPKLGNVPCRQAGQGKGKGDKNVVDRTGADEAAVTCWLHGELWQSKVPDWQ